MTESAVKQSGGDSDYYLANIVYPKRLEPYTAECEDIIYALGMTFAEGEAFKAIWRKAAARLNGGKIGDKPQRNADKTVHYGNGMNLELLYLKLKETNDDN